MSDIIHHVYMTIASRFETVLPVPRCRYLINSQLLYVLYRTDTRVMNSSPTVSLFLSRPSRLIKYLEIDCS
jgi:hypothetical protein